MKTQANPNKSITKRISSKSSTNGESFSGFGGGHRMDLAISHGITLIVILNKRQYIEEEIIIFPL